MDRRYQGMADSLVGEIAESDAFKFLLQEVRQIADKGPYPAFLILVRQWMG
jgi:hypothetical protein